MNTQNNTFTDSDRPFWFKCKPSMAHLLSCVFILSFGCRHTATKSPQYSSLEKEVNEVWNTENSESPLQALTVDYVTANPSPYLNGSVMISGAVTDLRVKKGPRGNMMLELKLTNKPVLQPLTDSKKNFTRLKLAGQLESIGDLMLESAQNMELSNLEPSTFKNMSYGLKIEGNRIQALSQFYRSKKLFEIGDDIESIAHGYLKLGDAIYTFSEIIVENESEIVIEQIDIEPVKINSINDSNEFQGAIKEVCKELCAISDELINNRYKIMEKKLVFDSQDISNTKAYSLLSIGDLLKAKSWESKKNKEQSAEIQFEIVSKGFTLLGEGMTNLYDGFRNLGSKLSLKVAPLPFPSSEDPILKCAYMGYNEQIIKDCKEKMMQLGKNDEITIQGQLIKGNLLEELNVLWINMQSVTIDDLTFDLAYDDVPTTWRNLTSFYDWVKETTN